MGCTQSKQKGGSAPAPAPAAAAAPAKEETQQAKPTPAAEGAEASPVQDAERDAPAPAEETKEAPATNPPAAAPAAAAPFARFVTRGRAEFNQNGWLAHQGGIADEIALVDSVDLGGRTYFVTGATSGIGYELTRYLLARGAFVYVMIRGDAAREAAFTDKMVAAVGGENTEDVRGRVRVLLGDCGSKRAVREAWGAFEAHQDVRRQGGAGAVALDGLVCNAGALLDTIQYTGEGMETTFATHLVFGAHYLTKLALGAAKGEDAPGRVVFVASGGMLNTEHVAWNMVPLFDEGARKALGEDAAGVFTGPAEAYNGQIQYAFAKRGQVLLAQHLAAAHPERKVVSCHPGWVATPGVDSAFGPTVRPMLEPLRDEDAGTLGIKWLLACPREQLQSGEFYLDCKPDWKYLDGARDAPVEEAAAVYEKLGMLVENINDAA